MERLATPPARHISNRSRMDVWADTLPETEREAVYKAAADKAWGHMDLLRVLMSEGAPKIADTSFRKWRTTVGYEVQA